MRYMIFNFQTHQVLTCSESYIWRHFQSMRVSVIQSPYWRILSWTIAHKSWYSSIVIHIPKSSLRTSLTLLRSVLHKCCMYSLLCLPISHSYPCLDCRNLPSVVTACTNRGKKKTLYIGNRVFSLASTPFFRTSTLTPFSSSK